MNNETCPEYGYKLKTSFRGLLGLIEGELRPLEDRRKNGFEKYHTRRS